MPAKELAIARSKDCRWRRGGSDRFLKSIHKAPFHVDAKKWRNFDQSLASLQKFISLLGADDISREQDDTCRLHASKQGTDLRRDLGSVKANDERLPGGVL
jgi:hypothetical protein